MQTRKPFARKYIAINSSNRAIKQKSIRTHSINSQFGDEGYLAFQVIDSNRITLLRTEHGREMYKIESEMEDDAGRYYCFKDAFFCTCPSYQFHGMNS